MLLCCCHGKVVGQVVARLAATDNSPAGQIEVDGCCLADAGEQSPADDGEHGPCDCRSQVDAKTLPEAKTTIDLAGSAPVLLVLIAERVEMVDLPVMRAAVSEGWSHAPPSTSLLRQHCALIV